MEGRPTSIHHSAFLIHHFLSCLSCPSCPSLLINRLFNRRVALTKLAPARLPLAVLTLLFVPLRNVSRTVLRRGDDARNRRSTFSFSRILPQFRQKRHGLRRRTPRHIGCRGVGSSAACFGFGSVQNEKTKARIFDCGSALRRGPCAGARRRAGRGGDGRAARWRQ